MAALLGGSAFADDAARSGSFNVDTYPPEVRKALAGASERCTGDGGGKVTFGPQTVRKLDLTGDGRDDYVLDFHDTECADRPVAYCGTGGCDMDILVTLPNGKIRTVFSDRVRNIEIPPAEAPAGKGARTIRFALHGSYCGGHGNPSCTKEHRMTAKPFEFKRPE